MAAMDEGKIVENRWLPTDLFPLLYQRIAAAGRPHDGDELPGQDREGNAGESRGLTVRRVIGKTYIYKFKDWFHKNSSDGVVHALERRLIVEICVPFRVYFIVWRAGKSGA